jgi:ADP-ribose pyrophosphatase YjhB (NUDIX family)
MARREGDNDLDDLKRGEVTKQKQTSRELPSGIILCVGGVVLEERRILLVRQAEGHPLQKQWTIPWGLVDPREAPEVAVLREIKEEAGVEAEIEGLLGIQNLPDPWDGWVGVIFKCKHISGFPKPDEGRETDRAKYFSLNDISTFAGDIEIWCEWLAYRVLRNEYHLIPPEPANPYAPKIAFM